MIGLLVLAIVIIVWPFVYRPATISAIGGYGMFDDFVPCIRNMLYVTEERKQFLSERLTYWNGIADIIHTGQIDAFDCE